MATLRSIAIVLITVLKPLKEEKKNLKKEQGVKGNPFCSPPRPYSY